jgi:hypothetical protein
MWLVWLAPCDRRVFELRLDLRRTLVRLLGRIRKPESTSDFVQSIIQFRIARPSLPQGLGSALSARLRARLAGRVRAPRRLFLLSPAEYLKNQIDNEQDDPKIFAVHVLRGCGMSGVRIGPISTPLGLNGREPSRA